MSSGLLLTDRSKFLVISKRPEGITGIMEGMGHESINIPSLEEIMSMEVRDVSIILYDFDEFGDKIIEDSDLISILLPLARIIAVTAKPYHETPAEDLIMLKNYAGVHDFISLQDSQISERITSQYGKYMVMSILKDGISSPANYTIAKELANTSLQSPIDMVGMFIVVESVVLYSCSFSSLYEHQEILLGIYLTALHGSLKHRSDPQNDVWIANLNEMQVFIYEHDDIIFFYLFRQLNDSLKTITTTKVKLTSESILSKFEKRLAEVYLSEDDESTIEEIVTEHQLTMPTIPLAKNDEFVITSSPLHEISSNVSEVLENQNCIFYNNYDQLIDLVVNEQVHIVVVNMDMEDSLIKVQEVFANNPKIVVIAVGSNPDTETLISYIQTPAINYILTNQSRRSQVLSVFEDAYSSIMTSVLFSKDEVIVDNIRNKSKIVLAAYTDPNLSKIISAENKTPIIRTYYFIVDNQILIHHSPFDNYNLDEIIDMNIVKLLASMDQMSHEISNKSLEGHYGIAVGNTYLLMFTMGENFHLFVMENVDTTNERKVIDPLKELSSSITRMLIERGGSPAYLDMHDINQEFVTTQLELVSYPTM